MPTPADRSVEARLERLERLVEELSRRLPAVAADAPDVEPAETTPSPALPRTRGRERSGVSAGSEAPSVPPVGSVMEEERIAAASAVAGSGTGARTVDAVVGGAAVAADAAPGVEPRRPRLAEALEGVRWDSQLWLNRLGIGVFLFGVAILFRYSIENGWITPWVRVGFGGALGAGLLAAGLRMDPARRRFVAVLLGGALATFYIVGFAAHVLYALVGFGTALAALSATTVLGLALAHRRGEPALGVLASLGGLGAPLVLGFAAGTAAGYAAHTVGVLALACLLYAWRGWRAVLWSAAPAAWLLLTVYSMGLTVLPGRGIAWVLPAAALAAWALTGALPVAAELFLRNRPVDLPTSPASASPDEGDEDDAGAMEALHWHGVALLPPLAALCVLWLAVEPSPRAWGMLAIATAVGYGVAGRWLEERSEALGGALTLAGSVLLPLGSFGALSGDALLVTLAAEGVALLALAARTGSRRVAAVGDALLAWAAAWALLRIGGMDGFVRSSRVADLAVIAALAAATRIGWSYTAREVYRAASAALLFFWLPAVLLPRSFGMDALPLAWTALGAALVVGGRREEGRVAVGTGHLVMAIALTLAILPAGTFAGGGGAVHPLAALAVAAATLVLAERGVAGDARNAYRVAGHVALAAWTWTVLAPVPHGVELALAASAGHALVALHLAGLVRNADLRVAAHLGMAALGCGVALRLLQPAEMGRAWSWPDVAVLAAMLLASGRVAEVQARRAYRLAVHLGVLAWLWAELAPLASGQAYVTVAWAAYAVGLLVWALRRPAPLAEKLALATLVAVVAKLFLVDLAVLEAIWRILLFLGVGGALLALSYALQPVRRAAADRPPPR